MRDKLFVWERPLRGPDLEALGDGAPDGPILGARVEHLGAKEALLADDVRRLLHDAALRRLSRSCSSGSTRSAADDLDEVVVEAWLARAPPRLVQAFSPSGTE